MASNNPNVTIDVKANTSAANAKLKALKTNISGTGAAARTTSSGMATLSQSSTRLIGSVTGLVAAYGGLRVAISTVGKLISVNKEFGDTMQAVRAVTEQNVGFSNQAFRDMQDEARKLGSVTRFSASEAAEGLKFLGMAGFSAKEATESLEATLQLAQAGALNLGRAADIVSNIMTAFGAETDQTQRFVDVLAKTAANANTDIEMLGQGMKFVAPLSAGLGVSLETTAASMAVLSNAGLQASMAGTGMRMMLVGLADPSNKAYKALSKLGLTFEDLNPQTNKFTDILRKLRNAGFGAQDAFKAFGARGGAAAAVMVRGADAVKNMEGRLLAAAGAGKQMSQTMDDSLAGAMKRVKSAWEEFLLATGEGGIGDALRDATEAIAGFLVKLNEGGTGQSFGRDLITAINQIATVMDNTVGNVIRGVNVIAQKFGGWITVLGLVAKGWLLLKARALVAGVTMKMAINGGIASLGAMTTALGVSRVQWAAYGQTLIATKMLFIHLKATGVGTMKAIATSAAMAGRSMAKAAIKAKVLKAALGLGILLALDKIQGGFERLFSGAFGGGFDTVASSAAKLNNALQMLQDTNENLDFIDGIGKSIGTLKSEEELEDLLKSITDEKKKIERAKEAFQATTESDTDYGKERLKNWDRQLSRIEKQKAKIAELGPEIIRIAQLDERRTKILREQLVAEQALFEATMERAEAAKELVSAMRDSLQESGLSRMGDDKEIKARLEILGLEDIEAVNKRIEELEAKSLGALEPTKEMISLQKEISALQDQETIGKVSGVAGDKLAQMRRQLDLLTDKREIINLSLDPEGKAQLDSLVTEYGEKELELIQKISYAESPEVVIAKLESELAAAQELKSFIGLAIEGNADAELKQKLEDLTQERTDIEISIADSSTTTLELISLQQRLQQIDSAENTINFALSDTESSVKLDQLQAQLNSLREESVELQIKVNNSEDLKLSKGEIQSLKERLEDIGKKKALITIGLDPNNKGKLVKDLRDIRKEIVDLSLKTEGKGATTYDTQSLDDAVAKLKELRAIQQESGLSEEELARLEKLAKAYEKLVGLQAAVNKKKEDGDAKDSKKASAQAKSLKWLEAEVAIAKLRLKEEDELADKAERLLEIRKKTAEIMKSTNIGEDKAEDMATALIDAQNRDNSDDSRNKDPFEQTIADELASIGGGGNVFSFGRVPEDKQDKIEDNTKVTADNTSGILDMISNLPVNPNGDTPPNPNVDIVPPNINVEGGIEDPAKKEENLITVSPTPLTLPQINFPELQQLPQINLPTLIAPSVEIDSPTTSVEVSPAQVTLPQITLPEISIPQVTEPKAIGLPNLEGVTSNKEAPIPKDLFGSAEAGNVSSLLTPLFSSIGQFDERISTGVQELVKLVTKMANKNPETNTTGIINGIVTY